MDSRKNLLSISGQRAKCLLVLAVVMTFSSIADAANPTEAQTKQALEAIYTALGGSGWTVKTNWNTAMPYCNTTDITMNWYGVQCSTGTTDVTALLLGNNKLTGTLPDDIATLTALQQLLLPGNSDLRGSLPAALSSLSQLRKLDVGITLVSGSIPSGFSAWTQLTEFRADFTSLSGTLPAELAKWKLLQEFHVESAKLSGSLPPEFAAWTNIVSLKLSRNSLSGDLPSEWSTMTELTDLRFDGNPIAGTLPDSWKTMSQMQQFAGSSCGLTGTLPASWSNMSLMQDIDISRNKKLRGQLPDSWFSSWSKINNLDLSHNKFTGTLPPTLAFSTQLVKLDLHGCYIEGTLPETWVVNVPDSFARIYGCVIDLSLNSLHSTLPSSWGSWKGITGLNLASQWINGSLPSSWGSLAYLDTLDLYDNYLDSTLPASWKALTELKELELGINGLKGSIPSEWGTGMINLQVLSIHDNHLDGLIPGSLFSGTELEIVELRNNAITGFEVPFPSTVVSTKIHSIDVSSNSLAGTIPPGLVSSPLATLRLNYNTLTGSLPEGWGANGTGLADLELHWNKLTGSVPASWSGMKTLKTLRLSENSLSGSPLTLTNLPLIEYIEMGGNQFNISLSSTTLSLSSSLLLVNVSYNELTGNFPETGWKGLAKLAQIDFSHNNIGGNLPSSWGSDDLSMYVDLSHNVLEGNIPNSWAQMKNARWIDLSYNQLSGNLPEFGAGGAQWQHLSMLNLGYNQFEGTLPLSWKTTFINLDWLTLTNNRLTGGIPDEFLEFKQLSILELGLNRFSGTLPWQSPAAALNVTSIYILNLASNNFFGTIPSSWGKLTQLNTLLLASNRLSGTLPDEFVALSQLEYLDVSINYGIEGTLPAAWTDTQKGKISTTLIGLNVGYTQIHGSFPPNWVDGMTALANLNIAGTLMGDTMPDAPFQSLQELSMDFVAMPNSRFPWKLMNSPWLHTLSMADCEITDEVPVFETSTLRMVDLRQNFITESSIRVINPTTIFDKMAYLNVEPASILVGPEGFASDLAAIPSAKHLLQTGPFTWRDPTNFPASLSKVTGLMPLMQMPTTVMSNAAIVPYPAFSFYREEEGTGLLPDLELFLTNEIVAEYKVTVTPFFPGEAFGPWGLLRTISDTVHGFTILQSYHLNARYGVEYKLRFTFYFHFPYTKKKSQTIVVDSLPIQREPCSAQRGMFAVNNTPYCASCPENAICNGTTALLSKVPAWKPQGDYLPVVACHPYEEGCLPFGNDPSQCLPGYMGQRCAQCNQTQGYYKSSRGCDECSPGLSTVGKVFMFIIAAAATLLILWFSAPSEDIDSRPTKTVKVISIFKYVFNIFGWLGILATATSSSRLTEPGWFTLDFSGFGGGATFWRQLFWACGNNTYNAGTQMNWAFAAMMILFGLAIIPIVVKILRRPGSHSPYFPALAGFATVLHLSFVSILVSTLRVAKDCYVNEFRSARSLILPGFGLPGFMPSSSPSGIPQEVYRYVVTDTSYQCSPGAGNAPAYDSAVAICALFCLVLPLVFFGLQFRLRSKVDADLSRNVMFFYTTNYKRKYFYWEYVILTRKWLLAAACAWAREDEQLTLVCAVFGVSLFLHEKYRPYSSAKLQLGESLALALGFVTSCLLALSQDRPNSNTESIFIVLLQITGFVGIAFAISRYWFKEDHNEEEDLPFGLDSEEKSTRLLGGERERIEARPSGLSDSYGASGTAAEETDRRRAETFGQELADVSPNTRSADDTEGGEERKKKKKSKKEKQKEKEEEEDEDAPTSGYGAL